MGTKDHRIQVNRSGHNPESLRKEMTFLTISHTMFELTASRGEARKKYQIDINHRCGIGGPNLRNPLPKQIDFHGAIFLKQTGYIRFLRGL